MEAWRWNSTSCIFALDDGEVSSTTRQRLDRKRSKSLSGHSGADEMHLLKGSDDGILHLKDSYFWTLSIVQCFLKNTSFRKQDLFPSSGKVKVGPSLLGPFLREGNRSSFETLCFWENIERWTKSKSMNLSRFTLFDHMSHRRSVCAHSLHTGTFIAFQLLIFYGLITLTPMFVLIMADSGKSRSTNMHKYLLIVRSAVILYSHLSTFWVGGVVSFNSNYETY
jgi:hypothetical protein